MVFDWALHVGGNEGDRGYSISTDANGNVYTTGVFYRTVDFDPGPGIYNLSSNGRADCFVQKLDSNGNFLWATQLGGDKTDCSRSISIDANGNVYTTGFFLNSVDFDPGPGIFNLSSNGSQDVFIQKLDPNGNFLWAKNIGSGFHDQGYSIATDFNGNIYTTGYFRNTVDFDPSPLATYNLTSNGSWDIFVLKLDPNGNFLWAAQLGGSSEDYGTAISTDANGNVVLTGVFKGTADFDPSLTTFNLFSNGGYDVFIEKLDPNGNFLWAKQMGGTGDDYGNAIKFNLNGAVYTAGYFEGTADFDPGIATANFTSNGSDDVFIQKLDPNGNFIWARQIGGPSADRCNSLALDSVGNVYSTGYFRMIVDFDPDIGVFNLSATSGSNVFIQKLDFNGNFVWAKQIASLSSSNRGHGINVDALGNIYTTGEFSNIADFDPGGGSFNLSSNGSLDMFIQKLSDSITILPLPIQIELKNSYSKAGQELLWTIKKADFRYVLERSIDGIEWITLEARTALTEEEIISLEDNYKQGDKLYYRILSEYNNGDQFLSNTQVLSLNETKANILAYPNPTQGLIKFEWRTTTKATIIMLDTDGQIVKNFYAVNSGDYLDLNNFPAGEYFAKIIFPNEKAVVRKIQKF